MKNKKNNSQKINDYFKYLNVENNNNSNNNFIGINQHNIIDMNSNTYNYSNINTIDNYLNS